MAIAFSSFSYPIYPTFRFTYRSLRSLFRFPAVPGLRLRAQWNGTLADARRHLGRDDDRPRPAALSSHQATGETETGRPVFDGRSCWSLALVDVDVGVKHLLIHKN